MYLKTIYELADSIAPFSLSKEYCEKYGARDNSGVQLGPGGEINSVLFSLDLSMAAIERAKQIKANCIITHHPAIFNPLYSLEAESGGKEILECAMAGISVISSHLNLDCAEGGIDDSLMQGLTGKNPERTMHTLSKGGYGKVYSVKEQSFDEFLKTIETRFKTKRMITYGSGTVKKVASFCGAGTDDDTVAFAVSSGADTFVSSDPKHHLVKELVEKGLKVVLLTHYAAEYYGLARYYEKFEKLLTEAGARSELFTDERFL